MGIDSTPGRRFGGLLLKAFVREGDRVVVWPLGTEPEKLSDPKPDRVDVLAFDQVTPTYGIMTTDAWKTMNDNLLVAVTAAKNALAKIKGEQRDWDTIVQAFLQCPLLDNDPQQSIYRVDDWSTQRTNWFKQRVEYASVANEVSIWLESLLQDSDVFLARGKRDLDAIMDVAHAGSLLDGIIHTGSGRRKLLDIGVLRYPDPEHPFIKVYRLQLEAWYESKVVLGHASDRNGIRAEFNLRQFRPRDAVIGLLDKELIDQVVKEARQYLV